MNRPTQGHRMEFKGREFLVMEPGEFCSRCSEIDRTLPYPLRPAEYLPNVQLKALPMVYFHHQVPQ